MLLVVLADDVEPAARDSISEAIVASGARYVSCWGHECSAWDTSIDLAYIATDSDFNPPENRFVVTTWHEDETLEEAFDFVWMNGSFGVEYPRVTGIFVIGKNEDVTKRVADYATERQREWNERRAQPGTIDNPDDAQRLREDHRVRTSPQRGV